MYWKGSSISKAERRHESIQHFLKYEMPREAEELGLELGNLHLCKSRRKYPQNKRLFNLNLP